MVQGIPIAHDVAAAVLEHVGKVEAMKLQKLVYYCQAWHLALTDEPLYRGHIQAWSAGPVDISLWEQHQNQRTVSSWTGYPDHLSERSSAIVALVCSVYGDLSGDELSEMTHAEQPWLEARGDLPADATSRARISEQSMKRFYRGRKLAGRTADDLAAGGVFAMSDPKVSAAERRQRLADIRQEFKGDPKAVPPGKHIWDPVAYPAWADIDDGASVAEVVVTRERPARVRRPR